VAVVEAVLVSRASLKQRGGGKMQCGVVELGRVDCKQ